MVEAGPLALLDEWLGPAIRADLEDRLWRPIGAQATLEALVDDPAFLADPAHHPAMFADHGVVHARDVAVGVVRLLDVVHGVLIPRRSATRARFVTALGVSTAYIHDIGMVDMSTEGRRAHAVVGARAAFGTDVDLLVEHLLEPGPVRDRLEVVAASSPFAVPLDTVVRELLSLSVTHSKSAVPAGVLRDRARLRETMRRIVSRDDAGSFAWLTAAPGAQADLADDAIDAMRVLRAADVLRQRGTGLRTSGGFELSMDAETARLVCTLRSATGDAAYVIAYDDPRGAGEANIREAFVTGHGDLRIGFARGGFGSAAANRLAATSVAGAIVDIAADVLPSFEAPTAGRGLVMPTRDPASMKLQVERPDDRPRFADEVAAAVTALEPSLASRLVVVADTGTAAPEAPAERDRFLRAVRIAAPSLDANDLLRRVAERGAEIDHIDRAAAFAEVGRVTVEAREVLVEAGSAPAFVYIPTGPGLVVRPGGGYAPSPLAPWVPVGTTGVTRRAERNSDIVAEQDVEVIVIPGALYAREWFRPLSPADLAARLRTSTRA
jgi:hypothetical protein